MDNWKIGITFFFFIHIYVNITDVVQVAPERRRVVVEIPEEVLAAAASGPGTTLNGVY